VSVPVVVVFIVAGVVVPGLTVAVGVVAVVGVVVLLLGRAGARGDGRKEMDVG
jgi:hypothetical protein